MDKQLFGSEAPLNHNSPLDYEHQGATKHGEMELDTASQAPTENRPIGLQEFDKHTLDGEIQTLGSHAPLSHKPVHGWQSDHAPCSDRAHQQSR